MIHIPVWKPLVSVSVNPCAKRRRSLKQDKTIQDKMGFGFSESKSKTHLLSCQSSLQESFSFLLLLSLGAPPSRGKARFRNLLSTGYQQSFPQSVPKGGVSPDVLLERWRHR